MKKKLFIIGISIVLLVGMLSGCVEEEEDDDEVLLDASFTWTAEDLTVTFDATGSEGEIVEYSWDFGDGTTAISEEPIHEYEYDDYGTYIVTLVVNDGTEDSEDTAEVTLEEEVPPANPPTVELELSEGIVNNTVTNGTTVTFTANVAEGAANVSETGYAWYIDDVLQDENASTFEYTFDEIGDFVVEVVVTDDDGLTGEASVEITVEELDENGNGNGENEE
jgi:hypothetical protein